MKRLSHLSIDELADGICLRAGRIAAAEAELLAGIGEFDERGGWSGVGMLSCVHWLSWKTGLSPGSAREHVRVAGRLRELPAVAEAFGRGWMSYSQVRALTRVARPDDEIDWVELARSTSGAQMEKLVRGIRRAQLLDEPVEDCERAEWLVRTRKSYDADGNLVMTVYAKAEVAPIVEAAFDAKRFELERGGGAAAQEAVAGVPAGTSEPCCETTGPGRGPATGAFPRERLTGRGCSEGHRRRRAAGDGAGHAVSREAVGRRRAPQPLPHDVRHRPAVRLGPDARRRATATFLTHSGDEDPAWSRRDRPAATGHAGGPAPLRPRPLPAPGQRQPARAAWHHRRRTLPLPRLHPAQEAARPPRAVLERRRPHRLRQPAASPRPPPAALATATSTPPWTTTAGWPTARSWQVSRARPRRRSGAVRWSGSPTTASPSSAS
jgi:hypothetical protein